MLPWEMPAGRREREFSINHAASGPTRTDDFSRELITQCRQAAPGGWRQQSDQPSPLEGPDPAR